MHEVYLEFVNMLSKYVDKYNKDDKFFLVGYNNASFDNSFLKAFFVQNGDSFFYSWFWVNSIDVMVLATQHLMMKRHLMKDFKQERFAFSDANFRLDNLSAMLRHRSREYVASRTKALSLLGDLAATRDPDRILDMGFAVVRSGGNIVTDPVGLQAGDSVEIVMKRRTIEAEIKKIK